MRTWFVTGLVAVCMWATVGAQAYRLAFKYTPNTRLTYGSTVNISGTTQTMGMSIPMNGTVAMSMVETVVGVNDDGSANLIMSMQNGCANITLSGLPGDQPTQTINQPIPAMTMSYTQSPLGAVSNMKMSGQAALIPGFDANMLTNLQGPGQGMSFPDRDLQIGDSWTADQTMEIMPGQKLTLKMTHRLVDAETVNGKTLLKILTDVAANLPNSTFTVPVGEGQPPVSISMSMGMQMTGATLLNPDAGEIQQSTFSGDVISSFAPVGGDANMTTTMNMHMSGALNKQ